MKNFAMFTATFMLLGSTAMAQVSSQDVIDSLQAQGFTPVEVKTGPSQIKAEAVRDGQRIEVVYDSASGQIIKQEFGPAGAQAGAGGIEVNVEGDDFVNASAAGGSVGGSTDDDGTPDQGSGDFDGDDNGGSDSDDHGSGSDDNGSGSDDNGSGSDDNGGSGSDDSGGSGNDDDSGSGSDDSDDSDDDSDSGDDDGSDDD